jgi:hypothetical protein
MISYLERKSSYFYQRISIKESQRRISIKDFNEEFEQRAPIKNFNKELQHRTTTKRFIKNFYNNSFILPMTGIKLFN